MSRRMKRTQRELTCIVFVQYKQLGQRERNCFLYIYVYIKIIRIKSYYISIKCLGIYYGFPPVRYGTRRVSCIEFYTVTFFKTCLGFIRFMKKKLQYMTADMVRIV